MYCFLRQYFLVDSNNITNIQIKKNLLDELNECSRKKNLQRGKEIHAEAVERGKDLCIYLAPGLVKMYAKCGRMVQARLVFDDMENPNVVSWTVVILGYVDNGDGLTALNMFAKMASQGCEPNCFTFVAALKANTCLALQNRGDCLQCGKQIHAAIGCQGQMDIYVQNALIDMYAKCGSMVNARQVFDDIQHPDIVSWNTLILGYAKNKEGFIALEMFAKLKSLGCPQDHITVVAALKACISLAMEQGGTEWLERGKQIHHSEISCHSDVYVKSTLIHMYARCGSMTDARKVFDGLKHPNAVSWNTLILGYANDGDGVTALDLYGKMKSQGCAPTCGTFVAILKACTSLADRAESLEQGRRIHSELGGNLHINVQNTLMVMYSKCGAMSDARRAFESINHTDVVSWSILILGYAENGEGVVALDMFARMRFGGCAPDAITLVAVFKACCLLGALEYGSELHSEFNKETQHLVTCLVDFYTKCGDLVEARKVFDSYPSKSRDLRTWTALLAGYSRLGEIDVMFEIFKGMRDAGFQPDGITFSCMLACCNYAGLVDKANEIFQEMSNIHGVVPTVEHYNCMVDILGRSKKLDDALALSRMMPCRPNASTWMTVLGACRKWKNVKIGWLAFKCVVSLGNTDSAAYVLMAHIYGSRAMWEEQEMVMKQYI